MGGDLNLGANSTLDQYIFSRGNPPLQWVGKVQDWPKPLPSGDWDSGGRIPGGSCKRRRKMFVTYNFK